MFRAMIILWGCLLAVESLSAKETKQSSLGSLHVVVSQRFFDDNKLSNVNGFSNWGALGFDATFGLYEFPYRIEPYVGVGYIQNTSILCSQNADGSCVRDAKGNKEKSEDSLKYQLFTFSTGIRHRVWDPDFFLVVPFVQAGMTYRYGRVRKQTLAVEQKLSLGGDFGAEIAGGFIVSFFYDHSISSDMDATWGLKDFGLVTTARYLPAGWWRHGLGLLSSTGGWDFGLGLALDW